MKDFEPGMLIQNNETGDVVEITGIGENTVDYRTKVRLVRVRKDRIHFDGKKRKRGYNVVQ